MAIASYTYVRHLRGYQITLTTANTNYGLADLLAAIDADVPAETRELVLQSDAGNGAAKVLIGDVNLSGTRYGVKLSTGDSRTYVQRRQSVDIRDIYLRTDTNASKVNVEMADF